jgi:serine/threonine-protein kinase
MLPFTLLDKISDGSAADLYLARRTDKAQVFVELSRDGVNQEPATTRSFLLEAQARQNLATTAIARREQMGQCADGRWFVMSEAIEGPSVRQALSSRGPWSPRDVAYMLMTLCDGLEYLHRRGLCHANLDPSLLYLTKVKSRWTLKLLDTGLILMRAPGLKPAPKARLVRSEYLAPERVRGQRATPSSDIYGLGVLGFEMLCGKPPFVGATDDETRRAHLTQATPPFPVEAGPLAAILQRCLSKASEERWPTAEALKDALKDFLGKEPDATPVVSTPIPLEAQAEKTIEAPRQLIGNYELLRKIGEGAMGTVYFARHTQICREVALKVLKPELAKDRSLVKRFFTEAQAASRIRNEHIVEVFDLVEEPRDAGGRVYLVMELLHGATVREIATRSPFPIGRAVHVVRQVARALSAAHAQGIIHRDVKPDNIFIVRKGSDHSYVKLLDFGVAKLLDAEHEANRTLVGTAMGTPNYMSPEQTRGERVDPRSDVYSLGVVLYNLLAGKVPHAASSIPGLLLAISTKPPEGLPASTPAGEAIPQALRNLVMLCLHKDASKRPQSMDELQALLRPFSPEPTNIPFGATANASRSARVPAQPASKRRKWLWAGAATLALSGAGFWVLRPGGGLPEPVSAPIAPVPSTPSLPVPAIAAPQETEPQPLMEAAPPPEAEPVPEISAEPPTVLPMPELEIRVSPRPRLNPPPPKARFLEALNAVSDETKVAPGPEEPPPPSAAEQELEPEALEEGDEIEP